MHATWRSRGDAKCKCARVIRCKVSCEFSCAKFREYQTTAIAIIKRNRRLLTLRLSELDPSIAKVCSPLVSREGWLSARGARNRSQRREPRPWRNAIFSVSSCPSNRSRIAIGNYRCRCTCTRASLRCRCLLNSSSAGINGGAVCDFANRVFSPRRFRRANISWSSIRGWNS